MSTRKRLFCVLEYRLFEIDWTMKFKDASSITNPCPQDNHWAEGFAQVPLEAENCLDQWEIDWRRQAINICIQELENPQPQVERSCPVMSINTILPIR